ncbi:MAG: hypothetical protein ACYDAL_14060 [Candidatus Dormibacteraceae bacterium]
MRPLTVVDLTAGVCLVASVASPWSISIPPAHIAESFGFQTPLCWLTLVALVAALLLTGRTAVAALAVAELAVIGWFAWAMWVVTTPRFTGLPFPFVGTDLIGPGWYAMAVGLLIVAGAVVKDLQDREVPPGPDLWILTAIPGYGLARLGHWFRGLTWTALFAGALYLGSTDSPDPALFADYGKSGNVPPPLPRSPEYVLLGLAAVLWVLSIALTVRRYRTASTYPR